MVDWMRRAKEEIEQARIRKMVREANKLPRLSDERVGQIMRELNQKLEANPLLLRDAGKTRH